MNKAIVSIVGFLLCFSAIAAEQTLEEKQTEFRNSVAKQVVGKTVFEAKKILEKLKYGYAIIEQPTVGDETIGKPGPLNFFLFVSTVLTVGKEAHAFRIYFPIGAGHIMGQIQHF